MGRTNAVTPETAFREPRMEALIDEYVRAAIDRGEYPAIFDDEHVTATIADLTKAYGDDGAGLRPRSSGWLATVMVGEYAQLHKLPGH